MCRILKLRRMHMLVERSGFTVTFIFVDAGSRGIYAVHYERGIA